ncbi:unnamed protein product [Symbiodinium sp. CCMP2456]|nr:unnamed protein product [Symbiodinium sp. CCMP2456]
MLLQQLHDAPCLTAAWKGMWEPFLGMLCELGTITSMVTVLLRGAACVLDCAESRDEMWQTAHPGGRLSMHVYKLEVPNDRRPLTSLGMLPGADAALLCPRCFDPGGP